MAPGTLPDERALDSAADWFSRFKRSEVSTAELEAFEAWYAEPGNALAYTEVEAVWLAGLTMDRDPRIAQVLSETLAQHPPKGAAERRPRRRHRWLPIAAVALAGVAIALVVAERGLLGESYQTALGEQRVVRLADGSRLRLDTNTKLRVRLTDGMRRIDLERGQAFFEVAHDSARPFVVHAGDTTVQALGTRFDVRREASQVRVALIEGRVKVERPDKAQQWTMAPGQQWSTTAPEAAPTPADVAATTSWVGGRLTFHKTTLSDAVTEVNRYTKAPVRLEDPGLSNELISGMFDTGDVEAFIAAMTELYPLQAVRRPDGGYNLKARAAVAG
jgi:transmembrane sensor